MKPNYIQVLSSNVTSFFLNESKFHKVLDNTTNTFDTDGPFFSSAKLNPVLNSVCPGTLV